MIPSELSEYLAFAINHNFSVMITGKPGGGKSDLVELAAQQAKSELIIFHPVVSDPTDFKGLPFPQPNGTAEFLPFGDLSRLINAKKKTVAFFDDLGQASPSVQAACMQLLLARRINNHTVSKHVTFMAATNRKQDNAAVSGILEPVKSRFMSIIELEISVDDWITWALNHAMPLELIAFIQLRPHFITHGELSKDIVNTSSPRTIAAVGTQQRAGLKKEFEFEVFKGAAGATFAAEYTGFLQLYRTIPPLDEIIKQPTKIKVPTDPSVLCALSYALAAAMKETNIDRVITFLNRMPTENAVACMQKAQLINKQICNNKAYMLWARQVAA